MLIFTDQLIAQPATFLETLYDKDVHRDGVYEPVASHATRLFLLFRTDDEADNFDRHSKLLC